MEKNFIYKGRSPIGIHIEAESIIKNGSIAIINIDLEKGKSAFKILIRSTKCQIPPGIYLNIFVLRNKATRLILIFLPALASSKSFQAKALAIKLSDVNKVENIISIKTELSKDSSNSFDKLIEIEYPKNKKLKVENNILRLIFEKRILKI
ncbi:hypothetical protein [Prochlorococcus sp. MIT 1223]|uniref:hypothetical protein n=1 Tax=Prochlorococcus sp. MIT 1223 TaxID=3096217 RepID=UPI002A763986|nr:hypothetical protein [Prochlorococcus sp. MIT 1223]